MLIHQMSFSLMTYPFPGNNIFQIKHKRSLMFNIPTLYSIDGIIFIENEIKASYQRFPL